MNKMKIISTESELNEYFEKGYLSNINHIADVLGVKMTKARELVKEIPKIKLSESLYQEIKDKRVNYWGKERVYRFYYNQHEVLRHLLKNGIIEVHYGDMRKVISKMHVTGDEVKIKNDFLLENLSLFSTMIGLSQSINDIIISDLGYYAVENGFENEKGEIKQQQELITKADVIKYTRMIKRDFYIKIKIDKRNIKYFQSLGRIKIEGIREAIIEMIKDYESQYH